MLGGQSHCQAQSEQQLGVPDILYNLSHAYGSNTLVELTHTWTVTYCKWTQMLSLIRWNAAHLDRLRLRVVKGSSEGLPVLLTTCLQGGRMEKPN